MLNRSNAERTVLGLSLTLLFVASLFASCTSRPRTPGPQDCAKVSDRRLVKNFKKRVRADRQFDNQRRYINVSIRDRVVTLEGRVSAADASAALEKYALDLGCVTKVENRLTTQTLVGGCAPGQKLCGDICIDRTSQCNLIN